MSDEKPPTPEDEASRQIAAQFRGKGKKKPRGKPFKKGDPDRPKGNPFPPGVSGNPGGRPSVREFRDACRDKSLALIKEVDDAIHNRRKLNLVQLQGVKLIWEGAQLLKSTIRIGGDDEGDAIRLGDDPVSELLARMTAAAARGSKPEGGEGPPPEGGGAPG